MRLVKSSSFKVSGPSEVPRIAEKLFFRNPSLCVYAQKLCQSGLIAVCVTTKYKQELVKNNYF